MIPGDFVCLPISGEVGKLVEFGEWLNGTGFDQYQHAAVYVGNQPGLPPAKYGYTMAAFPGGAHTIQLLQPPGELPGSLWSTGHIHPTDPQRKVIVETALSLRGTPYSAADYFALAAHRLGIPAPELKTYIRSSKHLICSQLVDYCYQAAGYQLFTDHRWNGYVTPADLAGLCV